MASIPANTIDIVLGYVVPHIKLHQASRRPHNSNGPFILALGGPQGSGKTTWAKTLEGALTQKHGLKTISVSLDDFYFDHDNLVRVRESDPGNKLFRTRGHPGTHDEVLGAKFFDSLKSGDGDVLIPFFDKSRFNGEGDRAPEKEWTRIKRDPPVDVLVFEGWCVGFRPLSGERIEEKWRKAGDITSTQLKTVQKNGVELPSCTLQNHSIENLKAMNENLRRYCSTFMGPENFDFLIHLDAADLMDVYTWRIEQEHALRRLKGTGMTDEQVISFVEGYMPGYELYLDDLRDVPFFPKGEKEKGQVSLILNKERRIVNHES
jgi:D-glycerate 3-kinase